MRFFLNACIFGQVSTVAIREELQTELAEVSITIWLTQSTLFNAYRQQDMRDMSNHRPKSGACVAARLQADLAQE